ncbi:MAG TPA: hypothetical protein VMS14_04345, partial [Ilumatobacteraceae bacterium]|nr:hypothetical protein [Ilumatobacteraceae bacterium]
LAVAVGITVVGPTASGYLEAYATGARPAQRTSIVNYPAGQAVANMAILRPSADGEITIELFGSAATGSAHVLVDVFGWFSSSGFKVMNGTMPVSAHGGRLIAVAPGRILDTRSGAPVAPVTQRTVTIRGATTLGTSTVIVPDDPDVVGVLLNVTAVRPNANTFVSVLPDAVPQGELPGTSNLNVAANQVRAAMVMVPVGADGTVRLFNGPATSHLLVDVLGYIETRPDDTRVGRVIPLTAPFRAFDTRQPAFGGVPLGPGQAEDWSFAAFTASVSIDNVPVGNQSALLGNLTNAKLSRQYLTVSVDPGYLTMYPTPAISNTPPPAISNLNSRESITGDSRAVPNMALVKYGANSTVRVFNAKGYAHYLFDVSAVVLAD